jgi:L(+)-tartrate dehydratase beta subunit
MTEPTLKTVNISSPVTDETVAGLNQGDIVFITGTVYTAREGVYKRVLETGEKLPIDLPSISNINFHCSPAASKNDDGSFNVGAVTATASFRFGKWMPDWFETSNAKLIIGKGGMSEESYRDLFLPVGAKYLTTVGYGTGALLGRGIKKTRDAIWLDELGLAQALWIFEVENFGPFIVDTGDDGSSLFEKSNVHVNERLKSLYKDLKPPTLSRYGETTSRDDEVI